MPARGWHREVKGAAPAGAPPPPAPKHARRVDGVNQWSPPARTCWSTGGGGQSAEGRLCGSARGTDEPRHFICGQISVTRSYYTISVPLEFPCYYDIVGKDHVAHPDNVRSMPQLIKYLQGALALVQTGGTRPPRGRAQI